MTKIKFFISLSLVGIPILHNDLSIYVSNGHKVYTITVGNKENEQDNNYFGV